MEFGVKTMVGMGSVDDYYRFVKAGADEIFCGFVPVEWNQKYGNLLPLNRREVFFYHVQIGAWNDLKILKKMEEVYHVPVTITLNALYYTKSQLRDILPLIRKLVDLGFQDFIIADLALILALKEAKIPCQIHISGEIGEWNVNTLKFLMDILSDKEKTSPHLKRIIFHRKNTFSDMKACIEYGKQQDQKLEFEAFFLNEMCHYTGGFCNSLHCDEMVHLCQIPYELVSIENCVKEDAVLQKWADKKREFEQADEEDFAEDTEEKELTGETGCGLCALWKMAEIGITHLKLVGRGKSAECMVADVQNVKKVIKILKKSVSEEEYIRKMKEEIFSGNCSGNCYYFDKKWWKENS